MLKVSSTVVSKLTLLEVDKACNKILIKSNKQTE